MKFFKLIANTKVKKIIILTIAALFASPVVFYGADSLINMNKIHYGVKINNQAVGGLYPDAAIKKFEKINQELAGKQVNLYWDEQEWNLKPHEIDVDFRTKEAVALAAKIGNTGNPANRFIQKINSWLGKESIKLKLNLNDEMLNEFLTEISSAIDRKPLNPSVAIKNGEALSVKGQTGLLLSKDTSRKTIEQAILSPTYRSKELPVFIIPTQIKYESAVKAAEKANNIISDPVIIKYQTSSWEIAKEGLLEMLNIEEAIIEGNPSLDVSVDNEKVKRKIESLTKEISKEPQDARFSAAGEKIVIIPSKDGVLINFDKAAQDINIAATNQELADREVLLTGTIIPSKFTTEKAQSMGIKEKISSYSTKYSSYLRSRVSNIHLLAKTLDGTIIAPGEVFSFNKTIGPRTAAKGYKEAPVIVNGKLVPGLGGGICQVTTTMFNTIFFAGLPIPERRNHSFYISKYPTGRDATVSYPSVDLKFRNDTGAYILIKGYVSSNSVTIALYGTEPGRTVTYNSTGFTRITGYPVERIPDSTLDKGVEKIMDSGISGRQITVYRTVKKENIVLFKDTFASKYRPKTQIVIYGTKPLPAEKPLAGKVPTSAAEATP